MIHLAKKNLIFHPSNVIWSYESWSETKLVKKKKVMLIILFLNKIIMLGITTSSNEWHSLFLMLARRGATC